MYDQMVEAPMLVPTTVTSCTRLIDMSCDCKSEGQAVSGHTVPEGLVRSRSPADLQLNAQHGGPAACVLLL